MRKNFASYGLVVLGTVFLLFAFYLVVSKALFVQGTAKAIGVVTGQDLVEEKREHDKDPAQRDMRYYFPRVSFKTSNGQVVEFRSEFGSGRDTYQVGEQVPVRYKISQPSIARIDDFTSMWVLPLVFGVVGLVFVVFGAIMVKALR